MDEDGVRWWEAIIHEALYSDELTMDNVRDRAPNIYATLESEAEGEPDRYIEEFPGGVQAYARDIALECRKLLEGSKARRRLSKLAELARQKGLILDSHQLEVIARYQTSLDNQLYKALRSLREAQEARSKNLEVTGEVIDNTEESST
jgi:hypothetical protein